VRDVVAVVNDVKHRSLDADAGLEAYIPMGQAPTFFQAYDLVVRSGDPIALVPAVRDAIWSVDPNQALGTPVRLEGYIDRTLRPRRLLTGRAQCVCRERASARGFRGLRRGRLSRGVAHEGDCHSRCARCPSLARHRHRPQRHR
jgi:hypothetical protein